MRKRNFTVIHIRKAHTECEYWIVQIPTCRSVQCSLRSWTAVRRGSGETRSCTGYVRYTGRCPVCPHCHQWFILFSTWSYNQTRMMVKLFAYLLYQQLYTQCSGEIWSLASPLKAIPLRVCSQANWFSMQWKRLWIQNQ